MRKVKPSMNVHGPAELNTSYKQCTVRMPRMRVFVRRLEHLEEDQVMSVHDSGCEIYDTMENIWSSNQGFANKVNSQSIVPAFFCIF